MNRHVFSFWGVLVVVTGGSLALPPTSSAQQPLRIYQPPLNSLPNFGYYNPAPAYRPLPSYPPVFRYGSRSGYGGHYQPSHDHMPHMARIPQDGKPPPDLRAHLIVLVPADAELRFNGMEVTGEEGTVRKFVSPPLTAGRRYVYNVQAQWRKEGQIVTATRKVHVKAGAHIELDFSKSDEREK